jgi:serine/threonine protein kinase
MDSHSGWVRLQILGEGGFGKVYRVIHKKTGDTLAVKESKEKYERFGQCLKLKEVVGLMKLQQEAKSAFGAAGHPHVILLHEVVLEQSGKLYMVGGGVVCHSMVLLRPSPVFGPTSPTYHCPHLHSTSSVSALVQRRRRRGSRSCTAMVALQ